ncbi:hypothetical protein F4778DRAFT_782782 [Xylariomycetidae sp. FL2044]|nr:hypothetical protein F4778DRAFT_782782 [Xylariomycetidae sp. FL2044]
MASYTKIILPLLSLSTFLTPVVPSQDLKGRGARCGNVFVGDNVWCETTVFQGLDGHPESEILYEIILQSTLPGDTFYPNNNHIACLYADRSFIISLDASSSNKGPLEFIPHFDVTHNLLTNNMKMRALCAFPQGVSKGGLTLDEVRRLARILINNCNKCGIIQVDELPENRTDDGELQFNWQDPAICQPPCIDPSKDLRLSNTTNFTTLGLSGATRVRDSRGGGGIGVLCAILWLFLMSMTTVVII